MNTTLLISSTFLAAVAANAAVQISEFEPNPAGNPDPDTTIELIGGTPFAPYDLWFLSIENDGFNGLVDRVNNIVGNYDANGRAVETFGDLENPSFTVVLTDNFTGNTSTDVDPLNDGNLDLSEFGTILDALGVSDNANDDGSLYGTTLGGDDILFNGEFEPLTVFREDSTGAWFNTVTVDFGTAEERIGIFDTDGEEVSSSLFLTGDPLAGPTYGTENPSFVPESSAISGLFGLAALLLARRRA